MVHATLIFTCRAYQVIDTHLDDAEEDEGPKEDCGASIVSATGTVLNKGYRRSYTYWGVRDEPKRPSLAWWLIEDDWSVEFVKS